MSRAGRARILIGALALGAVCSAPAAAIEVKTLRASRDLWATINVCSPTDQPNTVGIRGSMPSDGHAKDSMYMSFRLQHENASKQWVDLGGANARTGYLLVGHAAIRQGGASFQLVPIAGNPAMMLRGVVSYQWRHGKTVLATLSRPTSAPRKSLADTDPAGFSAASCVIG
ncbi:MAG TPA: hypothetical protein VII01_10365 [Solirubrobacteraceae bacterium]